MYNPSYNMDGVFYNIYQETLMFYVDVATK